MTDLKKAAQQALEALETIVDAIYVNSQQEANAVIKSDKAITALRAAIAEAEKQEPVAWAVVGDGEHGKYEVGRMLEKKSKPNFEYWEARGYDLIPLYTALPASQQDLILAEREAVCRIVTGLCISDNNAEEINRAIRARGQA